MRLTLPLLSNHRLRRRDPARQQRLSLAHGLHFVDAEPVRSMAPTGAPSSVWVHRVWRRP